MLVTNVCHIFLSDGHSNHVNPCIHCHTQTSAATFYPSIIFAVSTPLLTWVGHWSRGQFAPILAAAVIVQIETAIWSSKIGYQAPISFSSYNSELRWQKNVIKWKCSTIRFWNILKIYDILFIKSKSLIISAGTKPINIRNNFSLVFRKLLPWEYNQTQASRG